MHSIIPFLTQNYTYMHRKKVVCYKVILADWWDCG